MYTIEVGDGVRDAVLHRLRAQGVGASVHFDPPVHLQPYYLDLGNGPGSLPETERLARELITLPIFPDMSEADQDWVVTCLEGALREAAV
jgi:dTDP-4-amino-4,6-dideoxygalactose transaminase